MPLRNTRRRLKMPLKDTRRRLTVKMPQEKYNQLLFKSKELNSTVQDLVRMLVISWLESESTATNPVSAKIEKP